MLLKYFSILMVFFMPLFLNAQSSIPFPTMKDAYPADYYKIFKDRHAAVEKAISNPDLHWHFKTTEYWNRFVWYFKALTDEPEQILQIFETSYNYDKHQICDSYRRIMPPFVEGNPYLSDYYKKELPIMDERCKCVLNGYDKKLVQEIVEIGERDQEVRAQLDHASLAELKENGQWAKQQAMDVENLKAIEKIIAEHGYPGRSVVGKKNEAIAFLVIQHSGLEVIKKYLPAMNAAIEKRDLKPTVYPYLFDRMKVLQGEAQHFGTQNKLDNPNQLFEIHDRENVNQRRRKYALPALK